MKSKRLKSLLPAIFWEANCQLFEFKFQNFLDAQQIYDRSKLLTFQIQSSKHFYAQQIYNIFIHSKYVTNTKPNSRLCNVYRHLGANINEYYIDEMYGNYFIKIMEIYTSTQIE